MNTAYTGRHRTIYAEDADCCGRLHLRVHGATRERTVMTMTDLISRADAIEAIQNAYCKPCKERGDDYNEVRCRACKYDNAIIQIDALPSAEAVQRGW